MNRNVFKVNSSFGWNHFLSRNELLEERSAYLTDSRDWVIWCEIQRFGDRAELKRKCSFRWILSRLQYFSGKCRL